MSEHAKWRFTLSELAASLPAGNFARDELIDLLGKPDIAAAEPDDELADIKIGFRQIVEQHGLKELPRWLCMRLNMLEIVKVEPLENDPRGYSEQVTATFPKWLLDAEEAQ